MTKKKISEISALGLIYTIILAVIIAIFIGTTINTFYPSPEFPTEQTVQIKEPGNPEEQKLANLHNEKIQRDFEQKRQKWAENVSIIIISVSTILATLGLFLGNKLPIIPNGILLGGLFTIFYGIMTSFMSQSRYTIFGIVSASLIIIILAGYWKFVGFQKAKKQK